MIAHINIDQKKQEENLGTSLTFTKDIAQFLLNVKKIHNIDVKFQNNSMQLFTQAGQDIDYMEAAHKAMAQYVNPDLDNEEQLFIQKQYLEQFYLPQFDEKMFRLYNFGNSKTADSDANGSEEELSSV